MNYFLLIAAISITVFTACNNNSNSGSKAGIDSAQPKLETPAMAEIKTTAPIKDILSGYLQLKNALVNDNGSDAATAGNTMVVAFQKFDKSALTADQKKVYEDVEDDAREHAEHIGKNGGNIPHQREHYDMLSKDMYELVKTFGAGQSLYQDSCPMYNDGKGATWLSEVKEIRNPYLGKKMPTCGTVKEELK
ncbi:hypothetical protein A3860_39960 [Niastella vici]|uniref:DUF3347 domain-containing protein n=1 Tax=Niastella vici TaxID=1703345 RepID=A0A1V9G696_9BACT|nr:DUF3347 domain-containing protein [Niastella vici]OQP66100.1 hypothetical protein A3860_39960 [Niastella vici]